MTTRMKPQPAALLVDEQRLRVWLRTANVGDVIEYHRGFLALDRGKESPLGEERGLELDRVAGMLLALAQTGHGHLLQRRHGVADYSYLFVARSRPDRTPAAFKHLTSEGRP